MKQSSLQGIQQVWFEDKMISIPHIKVIEERVEVVQGVPELPELSLEEQKRADAKLQEIRKTLKKKVSMSN